jgi:hypothetical protein
MSHRRWRQRVAPGVSPGFKQFVEIPALEEDGRDFCRPFRGFGLFKDSLVPRAYARGYQSTARFAGSESVSLRGMHILN